nr:uncharacterized protein CTRU02_03138 [Colletotrichum truncatum]KAF6797107.1 hypothetical protein CTRU02_03138 [Colletotrichum truncatum]
MRVAIKSPVIWVDTLYLRQQPIPRVIMMVSPFISGDHYPLYRNRREL